MPNYIPFNIDVQFSYKGWVVSIVQGFNMQIYFSIDTFKLGDAIFKPLRENRMLEDEYVKNLVKSFSKEASLLYRTYEDKISVFHTFNWTEKCKRDAIMHIDSKLDNGIKYALKHNLIPSLKEFT